MSTKTAFHPYLRTGFEGILEAANRRSVPDCNPADEVVARMRRRYPSGGLNGTGRGEDGYGKDGKDGGDGGGGGGGGGGARGSSSGGLSAINELRSEVAGLKNRLDNMSGSGVCNGDGTITITITA